MKQNKSNEKRVVILALIAMLTMLSMLGNSFAASRNPDLTCTTTIDYSTSTFGTGFYIIHNGVRYTNGQHQAWPDTCGNTEHLTMTAPNFVSVYLFLSWACSGQSCSVSPTYGCSGSICTTTLTFKEGNGVTTISATWH